MDESKAIWKIIVDDKVIHYSCAKCDWTKEWDYPFVFKQKAAEIVLSNHLKTH